MNNQESRQCCSVEKNARWKHSDSVTTVPLTMQNFINLTGTPLLVIACRDGERDPFMASFSAVFESASVSCVRSGLSA
jgi:ureidoglycolate hydrolase